MKFKTTILRAIRRVVLFFSQVCLDWHLPYHLARIFKGQVVLEINGFKMNLDLKNDRGISKELFIFHKREHLSTDFITNNSVINPGDVVLDIGGNIGYYALLESRLVGPHGSVYAVEPVSNNLRLLKENIKINNVTNIKTFHMAIGDENKKAEIYVSRKGNLSSPINEKGGDYSGKEEVDMLTADSFVAKENIVPNLVRMDLEGYEKEVVKGMKKIFSMRPKILMEVHPRRMEAQEFQEMIDLLKKGGYTNATLIKERNKLWMNKKGEVKPFLIWLNKEINEGDSYAIGVGKIDHVRIEDLGSSISISNSSFHALFS
jgi:FkbM family methyltransferase